MKLWRQLHEGEEKLNLDVAAQRVGIARKTLDDYHLQLRRARRLGFDFEKNKFAKMGFLRKFVKDKSQGKQFDDRKDDDIDLFDDFPALQEGNLGTSGYIETPYQNAKIQMPPLNPSISYKSEENRKQVEGYLLSNTSKS